MFLNGAMERPQYRNAPMRKQTKKWKPLQNIIRQIPDISRISTVHEVAKLFSCFCTGKLRKV